MADFSDYAVQVRRTGGESKPNSPASNRATLVVTEKSAQAAEGRAERWAQQTYGGRWQAYFSTSRGLSPHDSARVRVGEKRSGWGT